MNQTPDSKNETAAGGAAGGGPAGPAPSGGPAPAGRPAEKEGGFWRVVGKILHILLMPLIWITRPLIFRVGGERGNPKVHFTSFSTLFYIWPILVVGVLGVLLDGIVTPAVLGWAWVTVVLAVIICIGADIDRTKAIALIAVVLILWFGGVLLKERHDIPVLSYIYTYLAGLNVQFNPGTAKVFNWATFIILLLVVGNAWFDGRFEITTREITHKRMFRTSDSLPRAAKRVKRDWRDWGESVLGLGAGDLIVLDSNRNVVMRIPNIPFLWFFRQDVDHILEVLATTEVEDVAAAIEEEEAG